MNWIRELQLSISPTDQVSARLHRPDRARWLLVLGPGAGAGMDTPFLEALVGALAERGMATLRYQFPYLERGRRRLDPPHVCHQVVRAAVNAAGLVADGLPLFAGGKSFGGRMTSQAAALRALRGVLGLVFVGFPLHPYGRPGVERADHLRGIGLPMLFLQGTRDKLADLSVLEPVVQRLQPRPTLVRFEEADHDFRWPRRRERGPEVVCAELADAVVTWAARVTESVDRPREAR